MKLPKATAQRHVLKQVSRRLRIWLQDWTGHGATSRSEEHSVSPLPLIPQAVALLAAVFADKLAGFLNGSLAPEASIVLRLTLGLLLLTIANHVVTAKTKVASTTGLVIPEGGGIKTSDRYTYSQKDRLFAKIVVFLFIFLSHRVCGKYNNDVHYLLR